MATSEELKLKRDRVVDYIAGIERDKTGGWDQLMADIKDLKAPRDWRIDVWAGCLAEGSMKPRDIPPRFARRVAEKYLKEQSIRIRDKAADAGSDVHRLLEQLSAGETAVIPAKYADHVNSWMAFHHDYQLRIVESEFTVYNPTYYYAGTGDFLAYSDVHPEWGLIAGDYKTSVSGIWPDIALQLAAIANGEFIGRADGTEDTSVLKDIKTFIGVQITAQGYSVVKANVTPSTFRIFLAAADVARWKRDYEQFALEEKPTFVEVREQFVEVKENHDIS